MTDDIIDWIMYDKIVSECKQLGMRKSIEYGTASLTLFEGIAILSRMNDKIARLNNLLYNNTNQSISTNETIDDTINDLINYAIYLRMLRQDGIR